MKMDGVLVSLFCPTLYCELSFSGVLPSIVPYWNYNRSTHNVAFCIFSCGTLNDLDKLLVVIFICNEKMNWQCKQYFVKTLRYFYQKLCRLFFSNAGVTGNLPEFEFDEFWRTIFWKWYKCNICIVTTSALDWKQLTIFYKFCPIKQINVSKNFIFGTYVSLFKSK